MDVSEAIRERRSIRAFLPDELPEETIRQLLDDARWAPSWANAQDWDVFVVTGNALSAVKSMLAERFAEAAGPVTDIRMPQRGEWPEHVLERMTYRRPAPGAEPAPPSRPGLSDVYGAPCLLLFAVHEQLAVEYACFDLGLLVENVCLAAHDRGLGTCIMAMAVRYADGLHEMVPQAAGRRFVVGVALGHPDPDSELNHVARERCPFGEIATFVA
jgi:nitroreductase